MMVLPGDVPVAANDKTEGKANEPDPDPDNNSQSPPPGQPHLSLKRRRYEGLDPVDEGIYGVSDFAGFKQRKKAKLQIQNSEIHATAAQTQIFKGITVYVNGWTSPSVQEIRTLVIRNGGVFEPYLNKHSVTHIITCTLTEAKMQEFKKMKVVRPEWLTESVKAGILLPWTNFVFSQTARPKPAITQAAATAPVLGFPQHAQTVAPVNTNANPRTLNFKSANTPARRPPVPIPITVVPMPCSISADASLPAIEEVDRDVLDALPTDMRQELENAWRRRSESPFPGKGPAAPPVQQASGSSSRAPPSRPSSRPPSAVPQRVFPQRSTINPTRLQQNALRLAPRSGGGGYVIDKASIHPNRPPNAFLRPTEADLRDLNIDPEVFAALPRGVQREQLTAARLIKTRGAIPEVSGERLILKPKKYVPPSDLFRQPPPYGKYPEKAKLRTQGKNKGEKVFFTETDDIQNLLEAWVNAFKKFEPAQKDVEFFAKFLVQSVDSARSSDTGVERAIAIVKWWLVLLRRYWGDYEHFEELGYEVEDAKVGEAWWKAFRDVKERIDIVARKKFGGKLSLR
ncbi:DNA repair protein [Mycena sanguinolenta]|uniref:DNA repair protein n=1 Tax=Mycena sanguinolenta TaxID=230812 RepID=A0A8H6YAL4_9AGAR|nr:DNA repair protein [Mycena sanguinolenta]